MVYCVWEYGVKPREVTGDPVTLLKASSIAIIPLPGAPVEGLSIIVDDEFLLKYNKFERNQLATRMIFKLTEDKKVLDKPVSEYAVFGPVLFAIDEEDLTLEKLKECQVYAKTIKKAAAEPEQKKQKIED